MNQPRAVGPFELLERLGAGGMGEVFRARDTRLNRFVAIKFLPEAASDTARERFQREAQAIAALNHAHICSLYEIGEQEGRPYLVLELLEGETLKQRLRHGAVAPEQTIEWGLEIAEALDAAHRKGVLHRDLKPDNLWITSDGHVKVLDFGLARLDSDGAAPDDKTLTSPGMTLGTIPYMSPEQARGEALDARSDLFSFGSVLYEMASGRPAFPAASAAEVTAAILKEQPPRISSVRPDTPPMLEQVTSRCLEKDPGLRYQSAADLRAELKRLKRESSSAASVAAVVPAPPRRGWVWTAAALVIVAVAAWGYWRWRGNAATPAATHTLALRQLTFTGLVRDAAISPDGKFLAYVNAGAKGASLHLLSVINGSDTEIRPPAPGCCSSPEFTPDGSSIYFLENRVLEAMPILGGAVRTIASDLCSSASFSPDGSQFAYIARAIPGDMLMVAYSDGSGAHMLNSPAPNGYSADNCWGGGSAPAAPAWSPDGNWIAAVRFGPNEPGSLVLVNAHNGKAARLGPQLEPPPSSLAWLPDSSGVLFTARLAPATTPQVYEMTQPGGKLVPITHDVQGYARVSVAAQAGGEVAMIHSNPQYSVWTQAKPGGPFQPLPGGGSSVDGGFGLTWTPQGDLLSVRAPGGRPQFWIEGGSTPPHQLVVADLPSLVYSPLVAPNGQIVFGDDSDNLYRMNADGSGLTKLMPGINASIPALVQNGTVVAFILESPSTAKVYSQTLAVVPLAGGQPRQISTVGIYTDFVLGMPGGESVLGYADMSADHSVGTVAEFFLKGGAPKIYHPRPYRSIPAVTNASGPFLLTPDAKILTTIGTVGGVSNIWAMPLDGAAFYPMTHFTDLAIANYAFAPDGRLAISRGADNSDVVIATGLTGAGKPKP
jgi:Tol biopolymer transport system component